MLPSSVLQYLQMKHLKEVLTFAYNSLMLRMVKSTC